jgi:hypothetical protein
MTPDLEYEETNPVARTTEDAPVAVTRTSI